MFYQPTWPMVRNRDDVSPPGSFDRMRPVTRNVAGRSFRFGTSPRNASGTVAPGPVPRFRSVELETGQGRGCRFRGDPPISTCANELLGGSSTGSATSRSASTVRVGEHRDDFSTRFPQGPPAARGRGRSSCGRRPARRRRDRGRPPPNPPGTSSRSARAVATGRSTPATATTVDSSSARAPGAPTAARACRTRPAGRSRSRWPSARSPRRAGTPGRPARARWACVASRPSPPRCAPQHRPRLARLPRLLWRRTVPTTPSPRATRSARSPPPRASPAAGRRVYDRNRDVLSNPNVLRVGQQLDLR